MTLEVFKDSLKNPVPPKQLHPLLKALWHEARGDWQAAHEIAQDITGPDGARVHAYLHRVEGDNWNASYWYRRAGRSLPENPLNEEWEELVQYFLGF